MPIKINFNVCDNSPECSGKAVCPTGAIYWDAETLNPLGEDGALCVDTCKCMSCGQCVGAEGCPVGAIIFAKTEEDLAVLTKDIALDINKIEALFVERYGAEPIDESICFSSDELYGKLGSGVIVIEEFADWSIQCLLSSIPIESILQLVRSITGVDTVQFLKCDCTGNKNEDVVLPSLKVFKDGILIIQVDGIFDNTQLEEFSSALRKSKI